jgi:hypothetical protein
LGAVLPEAKDECVAGHGVDANCDGLTDETVCCPYAMGTEIYRSRPPALYSAIVAGSRLALLGEELSCGVLSISCGGGQVALDTGAATVCMPQPPQCQDGEAIWYAGDASTPAGWKCIPCAIVVEFGGAFGGRRNCTTQPTITCPAGEVPTFDAESLTWICAPLCNGGAYDPHVLDANMVCVPC